MAFGVTALKVLFVANSNKNRPLRNVWHYIFLALCNTLYSKNSNYKICHMDIRGAVSFA